MRSRIFEEAHNYGRFTHIGGGALTAHPSTSSSDGSEESDSVTESESESDAAESRRLNAFQLGSEVSLGKMVPHAQNSTRPIFNSIQKHFIVIDSRDRDLLREHLFAFRVVFSSVIKNTVPQCQVFTRLTDVVEIRIKQMLMPDYVYMRQKTIRTGGTASAAAVAATATATATATAEAQEVIAILDVDGNNIRVWRKLLRAGGTGERGPAPITTVDGRTASSTWRRRRH